MSSVMSRVRDAGARRIAHTVAVLAFLGFFLMQSWQSLAWLVAGWTQDGLGLYPDAFLHIGHRVHEFAFASLFLVIFTGLLAQLRSPNRNISGQLQVIAAPIVLALGIGITGFTQMVPIVAIVGGFALITTLLHPTGRELLTSITPDRFNRYTLGLAVVAAVPLLAMVYWQLGLQMETLHPASHMHSEEIHAQHIEFGHFLITGVISTLLVVTGLLASFQQRGWWVPAWTGGIVAVVLGVASIVFPAAASAVGLPWAVAMVLYGIAFVATAEYTQNAEYDSPIERAWGVTA